jgi:nucleotide sugar dehydrogenase
VKIKKMNIGVIGGLGVVGSAIVDGMLHIGHSVAVYDIANNSKLSDILNTDICFICVPSPSEENTGKCDSTIVEETVKNLVKLNYKGIICIKSTVQPGTTRILSKKYKIENICFVPEFLRERCATEDFIKNHDICVIGTENSDTYKILKNAHGDLPREFSMVSWEEAEICKYFNNIYNATLVTLANSFYELCKSFDARYESVKSTIVKRDHIGDTYLNCNENLRGFGGMCLPKDLRAISHLCKEREINVDFFQNILLENEKYPITVFSGMREEDE